jgi:hypothetical protein
MTTLEMLIQLSADNLDLFESEQAGKIFTDRLIAELIEWTGIINADEALEFSDLWEQATEGNV